jgi:hypothetical protein
MPSFLNKPWNAPKPKKGSQAKTKLSPASIKWAKARAKKAGRRYPNLVDNMAATRRQTEQSTRKARGSTRP